MVGRSSRAAVFQVLGRPGLVEQNGAGEAWTYTAAPPARRGLSGGAGAALGLAGAFVPYVGLIGPGLGLANAALPDGPAPETRTIKIEFDPRGVVRDCTYASTGLPAGFAPPEGGPPVPVCSRAAS